VAEIESVLEGLGFGVLSGTQGKAESAIIDGPPASPCNAGGGTEAECWEIRKSREDLSG